MAGFLLVGRLRPHLAVEVRIVPSLHKARISGKLAHSIEAFHDWRFGSQPSRSGSVAHELTLPAWGATFLVIVQQLGRRKNVCAASSTRISRLLAECGHRDEGAREALIPLVYDELRLVALDDALGKLASLDPTQGRLIELRFFGGLSIEETAVVLGVSPATAKREWATARTWLRREMKRDATK